MARYPAIFFDSDGLITENEEYIYTFLDIMFDPYTFNAAQWLRKSFPIFIITTPTGASKGLTSANGVKYVNPSIPSLLKANSITVYDTLYCSHENGESAGLKKTDPYFIHRTACLNQFDLSESVITSTPPLDAWGRTSACSAPADLLAGHRRMHQNRFDKDEHGAENVLNVSS